MYQKRVKNENSLLDQMAERLVVIVLLYMIIVKVNNFPVDQMSEAIAIIVLIYQKIVKSKRTKNTKPSCDNCIAVLRNYQSKNIFSRSNVRTSDKNLLFVYQKRVRSKFSLVDLMAKGFVKTVLLYQKIVKHRK